MSDRVSRLVAVFVLAPMLSAHAQSRPTFDGLDWSALTTEAVGLLSEYIRINTTNPPGNELAGARFLKRVFDREGIEAQILDTTELGVGRANFYARLRGRGGKRAVALVHHIDVVPADRRFWTVDPFAGIVQDGYVWGRGAIDFKGQGIAHLVAMLALKRSGIALTRDIVFIANADEELLGARGAAVFVQRHADLLRDVEYVINEGAWNRIENGRLLFYSVAVAEKMNFSQRLTVRGTPGHGSRPNNDNPVLALLPALDSLARFEAPLTLTPVVARYFREIAPMYGGEQRQWLEDVGAALTNDRARAWILSDPAWHAYLRNTVQITVLTASDKTNLVPAEASAELDIRLLPGTDTAMFLASLRRVVPDPRVNWTRIFPVKSALDGPMETDLFRAVERLARERDPGALVAPLLVPGGTDMPWYRPLGIIAHGVDPFRLERSEQQRGLHGNDERVPVTSIGSGVRFVYDLLRSLQ
ncbi:MAG TPA: M20/M25/M40 family metallo-hydrolase [Gemmatimonadaceae bacterium]|nr:M20/M25/M40 family metallo-hydrolase [Gemmatimonadaceae bacterium]